MKGKQLFALLCVCLAGFFWAQPTEATSVAETQIQLHKRLFLDEEVPSEINQGGALGDASLLRDSQGVNGATFGIFEVSGFLGQLHSDPQQAQALLADEVHVLRNDLVALATPGHAEAARLKDRYPGITFVQKGVTAKGSFVDSTGVTVTEDGLLSARLATDQNQVYLIVELDSGEHDQVDQANLASYLVVDSAWCTQEVTHLYTKTRGYVREPYFRKMAQEANGATKALAGAKFVLSKTENGATYYLKTTAGTGSEWLKETEVKGSLLQDERVLKMLSDQQGIVRTNFGLKSGAYQFTEVATVTGYEISEAAQHIAVTIPKDVEQGIRINDQELAPISQLEELPVIYNQKAAGAKEFRKVDEQSGKALAGANFVVVNEELQYLTKEKQWVSADYANAHLTQVLVLTSDDQGLFAINGLTYGKYALLEVKAPGGYLLPENHFIDFEVNEVSDKTTEPLKIVNKKGQDKDTPPTDKDIPNELPRQRLPKTGMSQSVTFLAVGLLLILGALVWKIRANRQIEG